MNAQKRAAIHPVMDECVNEPCKHRTCGTNLVDSDRIKAIHNDGKCRLASACNSSRVSWCLRCVL